MIDRLAQEKTTVNQHTAPELIRKERLQVNLTHEERERIRACAAISMRSLAGFCRSAIRLYCDEIEREDMHYHKDAVLREERDESRPRFNTTLNKRTD